MSRPTLEEMYERALQLGRHEEAESIRKALEQRNQMMAQRMSGRRQGKIIWLRGNPFLPAHPDRGKGLSFDYIEIDEVRQRRPVWEGGFEVSGDAIERSHLRRARKLMRRHSAIKGE